MVNRLYIDVEDSNPLENQRIKLYMITFISSHTYTRLYLKSILRGNVWFASQNAHESTSFKVRQSVVD